MADVDQNRRDITYLHRRLGFGIDATTADQLAAGTYEQAVDRLLDITVPEVTETAGPPALTAYRLPPGKDDAAAKAAANQTLRADTVTLTRWWIDRMTLSSRPLAEKMTLLWHGHFATAISKVRFPVLMYGQNQLLRQGALGHFVDLVQQVAKDPAMLIWLDSNTNVKGRPNENFGRELMELFTLGVGNYSEADVKDAARSFTGWGLDRTTGQFAYRPAKHDDAPKMLLGHSVATGEDAINVITSNPASPRFVAAKLWSHLAAPVQTNDSVVNDLVGALGPSGDIRSLVRAIALHPQFRAAETRTALVKQPIEWYVGALRALKVRTDGKADLLSLNDLGQQPFNPPSVGGWPQNGYWINSATALSRLTVATRLAGRADLSAISGVAANGRAEAAARLLSIDGWSSATQKALDDTKTPTDLMVLALTSPEYVLN